jgi:predicted enzyme related to lactoylglutathione lyase
MPDQHGGFLWYELMTPDPADAKAFYGAVVGWDIEAESSMPGMDYRMIRRSDGGNAGGVMPLSDEMRNHGARPAWVGYISVSDVDATVAAIEADGGKSMMPAFDIPDVGRIAMVADPQGAPFYVMDPKPPAAEEGKGGDVFSVDKPQHVRWNELATTNTEAAIDFYQRQFGWSQEGDMDMPVLSDAAGGIEGGEMGKYRFIQHDGVMIGAVMPKMPDMPVSMWSYYIGVEDIDRAAATITQSGGQMLMEPMQIPGGEYALNAMDPQGAPFGLVGPRKS